jgi:ATP-dependent Clp protease adapter protein ClpS
VTLVSNRSLRLILQALLVSTLELQMNPVGVDPVWSLRLSTPRSSDNSSSDVNTSVIWSSSATSSQPNAKELSSLLLTGTIEPEDVTNLAAQIVRDAPVTLIAGLLDKIACVYWRNESDQIDLRMLENLPNANRRSVCGNVFKKGEIVWTCRTCAKDPTCVQCDSCYKGSDHTDHEVYFHRASGRGGCCDCGDPEAWSQCGNCNEHKGNNHCGIDPLAVIPADLLKGSRAVIAGVLGVITTYAVGTVRGFESYEDNCYVNDAKLATEQGREPSKLKVRLHNDDMHTYEEVTDALIAFNISSSVAQVMTTTVDIDGEASVFVGEAGDPRIRRASLVFMDRNGLLVSITPEKLANLGPNVAAAFQWLIAFGNGNDGLMRVVTEVLLQETDTLPSCAVAVQSVGVPAPNAIFEESAELDSKGELKEQQFPLSVQHNRADTPLRLDEDELSRTLRISPFSLCPRNSLAVLVLASPYLSPSLSKATNDLVILYQQDATFKAVYSQVMTMLYPALYGLYFRAVGLAKETVFSTTVQVYTADSIVTMMSSEGVNDRPLKERRESRFLPADSAQPSSSAVSTTADIGGAAPAPALATRSSAFKAPVNLMEILTSTFLVLLSDVGCVADRDDDNFVTHHSIRKRR